MKSAVLTGLSILLISCSLLAEEQQETNCADPTTQIDMDYCAGESFKKADAELNHLYKQQLDRLTDQNSKKRLRDAQRAWIVFRDKSCDYEAMPSYPGSSYSQEDTACREVFTKQRIEDINRYLACTENGCPE